MWVQNYTQCKASTNFHWKFVATRCNEAQIQTKLFNDKARWCTIHIANWLGKLLGVIIRSAQVTWKILLNNQLSLLLLMLLLLLLRLRLVHTYVHERRSWNNWNNWITRVNQVMINIIDWHCRTTRPTTKIRIQKDTQGLSITCIRRWLISII